jgi:hypothetical protein
MEQIKFKNGRVTVAVGEGAGKRHEVLEAPGVEIFKNDNGNLLIKTADHETTLIHPEHGTITLPKNDEIEVFIQEEYSDIGEYRKVMD